MILMKVTSQTESETGRGQPLQSLFMFSHPFQVVKRFCLGKDGGTKSDDFSEKLQKGMGRHF